MVGGVCFSEIALDASWCCSLHTYDTWKLPNKFQRIIFIKCQKSAKQNNVLVESEFSSNFMSTLWLLSTILHLFVLFWLLLLPLWHFSADYKLDTRIYVWIDVFLCVVLPPAKYVIKFGHSHNNNVIYKFSQLRPTATSIGAHSFISVYCFHRQNQWTFYQHIYNRMHG